MFPILHIGPLSIPLPGLILILGIWLGITLAEKHSYKLGVSANTVYNLVFVSLVAGLVFARLSYVIRFPSSFFENPLTLILPNPNLFDVQGGIAGAILAAVIYGNRKKLGLWPTLDGLTPMFAVFFIALHLSNLASGNAYGSPTELPWGIKLWNETRHPTQLYEAVSACIILLITWPGRHWISKVSPGGLFLVFLALASFSRLICEAFRGDSLTIFGHYRLAQILSLVMLMVSLWVLHKKIPEIPNEAGL